MAAGKDEEDAASPDDIMSPSEMKPILSKAKRGGTVFFVVGMTSDKEGLVLLDRRRAPKALVTALRKQATELGLEVNLTSLRFGTATVDPKVDAKLVTLAVNKDAGGALRQALLDQFKRAGFSKIAFVAE
jgi:hypothetical protein